MAKGFRHESDVPKIRIGYLPRNKPETLPPSHVCQTVSFDGASEQKSGAGCDMSWSRDHKVPLSSNHKVPLCCFLPINSHHPLS